MQTAMNRVTVETGGRVQWGLMWEVKTNFGGSFHELLRWLDDVTDPGHLQGCFYVFFWWTHSISCEPKIQKGKEAGLCHSLRVRDSVLHLFTEYSDMICAFWAIKAGQDCVGLRWILSCLSKIISPPLNVIAKNAVHLAQDISWLQAAAFCTV